MIQTPSLPSCPSCNQSTHFIPASLITITDLDHIEFFFQSPYFSYLITDGENGDYRHVAAHFSKCNSSIPENLPDLPPNYTLEKWAESDPVNSRQAGAIGTLVCDSCNHFEKHIIGEQIRLS
ncbi:MAG: hypothetical protein AB8G05_03720 [Oligoflexales bacterium]